MNRESCSFVGKKRVIKKGEEAGVHDGSAASGAPHALRRGAARGIAFIRATYNNTLVSVADEKGNVLAWSSAGSVGFSGAKKATPYAAARVSEIVAEKARRAGIGEVAVRVSGVGSGRDSAIRALANNGLTLVSIKDTTPLPHNGPRPAKVRRV